MIPKSKRIENRELLDSYREMNCTVCFRRGGGQIVAHHIRTKGAGGHDHSKNLIPVCHEHHREFHDHGLRYMIDKYDAVENYLIWLGFIISKEEITFPEIFINS